MSQIELNYCSQDLQITLLKQKILTFKSNTVYFYRVSKLNTLQCYQAVAHSSNDYYSFITMAIQDLKKKKTKNNNKKKKTVSSKWFSSLPWHIFSKQQTKLPREITLQLCVSNNYNLTHLLCIQINNGFFGVVITMRSILI